MTWIIGSPRVFGYSLLLSDVRVTLGDGTERDCLQKIYPVGRFLVAGFAGDVRIGLTMIGVLQRWLHHEDETKAWIPEETAELLPAIARDVFHDFAAENRESGCHLMLAGVHPTERLGAAPWARPSLYRFRSPEFTPEPAAINTFVSIGSGGYVDEYRQVLEGVSGMKTDFMNIETMGGPFGHSGGSLLSSILRKEMDRRPVEGISRHFHICVVRIGEISFSNNDVNIYPQSGEKIEFRMPKVATTWSELMEILGDNPRGLSGMRA
jgi:hypothetical protein